MAGDAEKMGMIYKMYAAEDFNLEVVALAQKLSKMPTKALGLTKRLLNQSLTNDVTGQLELESKLQIEAAESDDYAEGVRAFMEKRKPVFTGK